MLHAKCWLPVVAAGMLGACATVPADRGMGEVRALLAERGTLLPDAAAQTHEPAPPGEPLTPDHAVASALLHNPELRAEYARLGLVQADVLEAGRLSNPELSLSALETGAAGESMRLGYGLVQNFTDLLLLRARGELAAGHLAREKSRVAERIRTLALDTRHAALVAVSAAQVAEMRDLVAGAARAAGEFAQRLFDAGNINELELAREQAAATGAALAADAARAESDAARWRLHRLMGLRAGADHGVLVRGLPPPLPDGEAESLAALQARARAARLDLVAERGDAAGARAAADLVRRWRWLPFLAVGVEGEREGDGVHLVGPTVALELPLFNQGQDRVLRAEATAELAAAAATRMELDVDLDVAVAHGRMVAARRRVERHVAELIPQRESIVARLREMQNWMLVGQFDLILARQAEYDAYQSYLEAVRDYWLARAELEHAVGAPLPATTADATATVTAPLLPDPASGAGHDHHGGHDAAPSPNVDAEPGAEPGAGHEHH